MTVTGVNDDYADGNQPYAIAFTATTSSDAAYAAITPANVTLTNTDNDSAGITVSAISGPTTEAGGQASFTVVLTSKPYADVTVNFASNNPSEGTAGVASLTFTELNWNAPQTVFVTGANDDSADGNQPYAIAFAATTSSDAAYAAITPANVTLTNTDNDSAGITVSPISGSTTEAGGQASFSVVLTSKPYANVTVNFASNSPDEGTTATNSVTFTPVNWNAPQTVLVTGANDDLADGTQPYAIVFSATTSTDAAYAAIRPANVAVSNIDNDTAGIIVSAISGPTTEAGGQATFTVVLRSQPFANVSVNFASNTPAEGVTGVTSLLFTPANWNAPRTVTVTGVNDDFADGNQPYAIVFSATTSTDAAYAAITPANVTASNTDNDSAGITVSAISGPTTEAGAQASFTVVLTSKPYANVTVNFASNKTSEGTVSAGSITFTPANWNAPRTVLVTGVNDDFADGNQPYAIVFSATTSTDAAYAAIKPANVLVTNTDNDSAGITVGVLSGSTTEAGGQATFTVVLTSRPYANVTVGLNSSDLTEATVDLTSLTFTAANWNAPQTVTLTGLDDMVADGNQVFPVTFTAVTSTDAAYAAIVVPNLAVTNVDNDTAGFAVSTVSGSVTEAGGSATFTVALTSEPLANVTLNFNSSDLGEATVDVTQLSFTPANWNAAQTVVVTGINDDIADQNQPWNVVFSATTSTDATYAALTPPNVAGETLDDDSAGINVTQSGNSTSEAGGTMTFSIALNSEPLDAVVINFASSDLTEATLSATSLTFTPANWNVSQTVTVTGVNDAVADGNQPYAIAFSATVSTDPTYAAMIPANLNLTNVDDSDAPGILVSAISGPTSEAGGSSVFTVALNSEPVAEVLIQFASNDLSEGTVSVNFLTFTPANWNVAQTVTVTGVNDAIVDGNQPYAIVFQPSISADPLYNGRIVPNVNLTNTDNDGGVITSWNFDTGLQGWTVTGDGGAVQWAADGSPGTVSGGAVSSPPFSLNYNNGTNYENGATHSGTATSPVVNIAGTAGPRLMFRCNYHTETSGISWDHRIIEIWSGATLLTSAQLSGSSNPAGACPGMGVWHTHTLPLDPAWGAIRVRTRFSTIDYIENAYPGWFVDNVEVSVAP